MMRDLFLGNARTRRAIPIDHVVNAEHRVRFDVSKVFVESPRPHPNRPSSLAIAGWATRGMDDNKIDGLRSEAPSAARFRLDGKCAQHCNR